MSKSIQTEQSLVLLFRQSKRRQKPDISHLSEPSSTTILYQFGDDGEKIEFPMITMCAPSQLYETAFQNACGLSVEVMFYDFLSVSRPFLMLQQKQFLKFR